MDADGLKQGIATVVARIHRRILSRPEVLNVSMTYMSLETFVTKKQRISKGGCWQKFKKFPPPAGEKSEI